MKRSTPIFRILTLSILVSLTLFVGACGETDDADADNGDNGDNGSAAAFSVAIDEDSSTLGVDAGDTVEVGFIVENTGNETGTATVSYSIGETTDEMDIEVEAGSDSSGSFSWDTDAGDAGDYTAEVTVGDSTDSVDITVSAGDNNGDANNGNNNDTNNDADGAFFEIAIDQDRSTLTVDEGDSIIIFIVATNTGTAEGVVDISGQIAMEGGGIAELQPEAEDGSADTPIPVGQSAQIQAELPTGAGDQSLSAGEHTLTLSSQDDSVTATITVN